MSLRAFSLLLLVLGAGCTKRPPNVIIISIDTLRADYVGAYGARVPTPNLDDFARDSRLFLNAWSPCPLTLPSHLSLMTALLPPEHGVRNNVGYRFDPAKHTSLAARMRASGYKTGAAISAYVLRGDTGMSAGFDDFDDAIGVVDTAPLGALRRDGNISEKVAEQWITRQGSAPFFYFLHLYEPHAPHATSYGDDVLAADRIAGSFLRFLKAKGLYDDAMIVVLSDHGEGLMDHGEAEHGVFLYRETMQIPLMIKYPRRRHQGVERAAVQLVDVAPTILAEAGIKGSFGRDGTLLRPTGLPIYGESFYPRVHLGWHELRSVLHDSVHLVDALRPEIYDLSRDPGERRNIVDERRRDLVRLRRELLAFGGAFTPAGDITAEERRKLAALGYVSAGKEAEGSVLPDPKDRIGDLGMLKEIAALKDRADHPAVIAAITPLLERNPLWSDLRDDLAQAHHHIGDFESEARVFEEGIAATPRLAGPFALNAASAWIDARRFDAAEKHARFAVAAGERAAHLLLGDIALGRGRLDEAAREQSAAAMLPERRSQALFLAARIAVARRDFTAALQLLKSSLEEAQRTRASLPEHFHYVTADTLARVGRVEDAEREFEREIALNPSHEQAYLDLAMLQKIVGKHDAAAATLAKRKAARDLRQQASAGRVP